MSRYKISIFNKKEGRVINLSSITELKDLESIDKFTTSFENENEFAIYLFNKGLITNEELKDKLSIVYKYNGKVKNLNVFYKDMKKYLDVEFLRHKLKSLSNDVIFLEKLANFYHNGSTSFNKQGTNVSDIRLYLRDVRVNDGKTFYSKALEIAIDDLFNKAIFTLPNKDTGEVKHDYRGFRDLVAFIYKYEKSKEKIEEKIDKKEDAKETIANELEWEQTTLFDLINRQNYNVKEEPKKWVLSSEGEPDFPPNSEEERNYLRYLSELEEISNNEPIENHPHYRR